MERRQARTVNHMKLCGVAKIYYVVLLQYDLKHNKSRQELAEAAGGGQSLQATLQQRLDAAHGEWLQRQRLSGAGGAAEASGWSTQAARDLGIEQATQCLGTSLFDALDSGGHCRGRGELSGTWRHDPGMAAAIRVGRGLDRGACQRFGGHGVRHRR